MPTGGGCGSGDTTQRDELLAKIANTKSLDVKSGRAQTLGERCLQMFTSRISNRFAI